MTSFICDSLCCPEVVDKIAVLIYWDLEYSESTHKLWQFIYEHMRCPLVSHCDCLEMTYISYRHLTVYMACLLSSVDVYNLEEKADSCMHCTTFIYIINLACFNSAAINLHILLFSE